MIEIDQGKFRQSIKIRQDIGPPLVMAGIFQCIVKLTTQAEACTQKKFITGIHIHQALACPEIDFRVDSNSPLLHLTFTQPPFGTKKMLKVDKDSVLLPIF